MTPIAPVGPDVVSLLWQIDTSHVIWYAAIYSENAFLPITINKDLQK